MAKSALSTVLHDKSCSIEEVDPFNVDCGIFFAGFTIQVALDAETASVSLFFVRIFDLKGDGNGGIFVELRLLLLLQSVEETKFGTINIMILLYNQ